MNAARSGHTSTLLQSGKVMVAGGSLNAGNNGTVFTVEMYDPASDSWTTDPNSMNAARWFHTATLLPNGKVLVTGGGRFQVSGSFNSVELYDPASDTWSPSPHTLNIGRQSHTATLLPNGKVLIAGGGSNANNTENTAELYDPATDTFTLSSNHMTTGRSGHAASLLPNGKVLIEGGFNTSAELYDPATDTWTSLSHALNVARVDHTSTLLPNGKVLVTGGEQSGGGLTSAELYLPNPPPADSWTLTTSMNASRFFHAATLLPNGKVLVSGGFYNSGSVEFYDMGVSVQPIVTAISGNNQTATNGTAVAIAPSVQVTYPSGINVGAGFVVTFSVASGGGSVTGATAKTDANGIATLGSWTVGTNSGSNTLSVACSTATPATFSATGVVNAPTTIVVNGGDNQSAVVNNSVAVAPSVLVKDQFGNAIFDGAAVTFTVLSGSGTVTGGSVTTTGGVATVGGWKLGKMAGSNSLSVASGSAPTATINSTGTPDIAAVIAASAGNNQTATVNTTVAVAPAVSVKDQFGNSVVDGTAVTFVIATGGGSITGGSATTSGGIATLGSWKLGTAAGNKTLTVTSGAAPAATLTATGTPDVPFTIGINAGNNQSATVNTNVPVLPAVLVKDQFGNTVANSTPVVFTVASGGGSISGGNTSTSSGVATSGAWQLGTVSGLDTLSVTCGTAPAATITATANPDVPAAVTVNAGNNQSAKVNTNVPVAPSVLVKDQFGNRVGNGTTVTFAISTGGGSITGGTATTVAGVATVGSWKLGTLVGSNTLLVSSGAASSQILTATGTPDVPAAITASAGNNQSATVNTNVAIAPAVLVKDQFGNTVADGTVVAFAIATGGGALTGASAATLNGIATLGSWKLGTAAGIKTLTVTSGAAPAASISATATADVAAAITVNSGNNQSAAVNANVPIPPVVAVKDQFGNTVANGTTVTFAVASGGGSVTGASALTVNGLAACGSWKLGTTLGVNTLSATSGAAPAVTISATATSDVPAVLTVNAGNNQSATVNTAVPVAPSVTVKDRYGNLVANGTPITFAIGSGGGAVTGGSAITTAGIATLGTWKLGTAAGSNTLIVSSLTAPSVQINATGTPDVPGAIIVSIGNNQGATVNSNVPVAPGVTVTDIFGNTVADGTTVAFSVNVGGGSVTGSSAVTTGGVATVGSWKLGTLAGTNSLKVTSGVAPAAVITATGTPDVPATLTIVAGNGQSGTLGSVLPIAPAVLVKDRFANKAADGTPVLFAVAGGDATIVGGSATTVNGVATLGSWQLGTRAGIDTLTVTCGTAPSVTFTATAVPGAVSTLVIVAGNNQSALAGTAVPIAPSVKVQDKFGNGAPDGTRVTFAIAAGAGSVTGGSAVTANGIATVGSWVLGRTSGTNVLRVSSAGAAPVDIGAVATLNTAPVIASAPFATPAQSTVLQPVLFSVSATDVDNETLTYSWNFGDGATGSGASPSHSYIVPGVYTVTVNIMDAANLVTATLQVTVVPAVAAAGGGADSDGDGFSDALEAAAGSNPLDASSTPLGKPLDASTIGTLTVGKALIKLNFAKSGADSISVSGAVPVPQNFQLQGAVMLLEAGGVAKKITLNSKGTFKQNNDSFKLTVKEKNGVVQATPAAKFSATFSNGAFRDALAGTAGLTNDDLKAVQRPVVFTAIFNGAVLQGTHTLVYTSKKGKSGLAK